MGALRLLHRQGIALTPPLAGIRVRRTFRSSAVDLQRLEDKYADCCNLLFLHKPKLGPNAWIAPSASVLGNVTLGQDSSVFYNCTIRADINHITIGNRSNIQDNTVIHVSTPAGVTIGILIPSPLFSYSFCFLYNIQYECPLIMRPCAFFMFGAEGLKELYGRLGW